jgi:hypothetical protein
VEVVVQQVEVEVICLRRFWMRMNRPDIRVNHRKVLVSHWIGLCILPAAVAAVETLVAVVVAAVAFLPLRPVQVGFDDLSNPQSLMIGISFHYRPAKHGCLFFFLYKCLVAVQRRS